MKVVFIASLVHSGSTVLDLLLGQHPRLAGLGEPIGLLDPRHGHRARRGQIVCSCGATLAHCPFWGPLLADADDDAGRGMVERYADLSRRFRDHFGERRLLVDSSKSLQALAVWAGLPGVELRVLHLLRDVRGWSGSMQALQRRLGQSRPGELLRQFGWRAPRHWLADTTANRFRQWYRGNRRIEEFLADSRLPTLRLGYEELCLHSRSTLSAIAGFLEIEPFGEVESLAESASHVALGNRMHGEPEKRRGLSYDGRWMQRREWLLPALLLRGVMAYNLERVYRNRPSPDP